MGGSKSKALNESVILIDHPERDNQNQEMQQEQQDLNDALDHQQIRASIGGAFGQLGHPSSLVSQQSENADRSEVGSS